MNFQIPYQVKANIFAYPSYGYATSQFEYFRIGIALFSLFNFLLFLLDYDVLLAYNGMINWEVTNANSFWFEPHLQKFTNFISPTLLLNTLSFTYILSLSLLALGYKTGITSILSFSCFLLFSFQLYPYLYGVDLYQSVLLFFLCIFPSGYSKSLFQKKINPTTNSVQQIAVRAIQIYLMITYFSAGIGKVQMPSWLNGEFLFLSISDPTYQLIPFPNYFGASFFAISGCIVVFMELFYPVLVFIPIIRSLLLIGIIGMHAFIVLFMGLVPFGTLLIIINLIAWYPLFRKDLITIFQNKKS